jgi:hypothetical protein
MRVRRGVAVVPALLAARMSAVRTVAPVCKSRLPMMEIHVRYRGWSAMKSEEKKRLCESLPRTDFPPSAREAMQAKTT